MTTDSISDIIRINTTLTPTGAVGVEHGRSLFLTTDTSRKSRVSVYANAAAVAADYAAATEPNKASLAYFAVDPAPKSLLVGRWISQEAPTTIVGGNPSSEGTITGLGSGATLILDGVDVAGLDFTSISTYVDQAAEIQTRLQALNPTDPRFEDATCVYNAGQARFEVSFDGSADFDGALFAGSAAGDLSLDEASEAVYTQGEAADASIGDALTAIEGIDSGFYYVITESSIQDTDNADLVSNWVNARKKMYFAEFHQESALVTADVTSRAALLSAREPSRTVGTWSETLDYKSAAAAALLSSVQYSQNDSVITLFLKSLPGRAADLITVSQREELERKNIGYYISRLGQNAYGQGKTLAGNWSDVQAWLDWFEYEIQVQVFNVIRNANRIPLTAPGMAIIKDTIENVCRIGVDNGGISPRAASPALAASIRQVTGNLNFDGTLSNGYLVYHKPVSTLTQATRDLRHAPPFNVWVTGSGALQYMNLSLTLEN